MPYAIHLMGELAERETEVEMAKGGRWIHIDVHGVAAQEFLRVTRLLGRPTMVRVARDCFADGTSGTYEKIGRAYMNALRAADMIGSSVNARGKLVVYALETEEGEGE
jgi:hypothetical protein